jgi:hypothetical protein
MSECEHLSCIPNTITGPQDDNIPETCSVPKGAGRLPAMTLMRVDNDINATMKKKVLESRIIYNMSLNDKGKRVIG